MSLFKKMKGDEKILCMVSDSVLAKRRHVAALHQIQSLSQTAIIRKHKYSHRLVQRWMNVPHTAPNTAFGHPTLGSSFSSNLKSRLSCYDQNTNYCMPACREASNHTSLVNFCAFSPAGMSSECCVWCSVWPIFARVCENSYAFELLLFVTGLGFDGKQQRACAWHARCLRPCTRFSRHPSFFLKSDTFFGWCYKDTLKF